LLLHKFGLVECRLIIKWVFGVFHVQLFAESLEHDGQLGLVFLVSLLLISIIVFSVHLAHFLLNNDCILVEFDLWLAL